jgi:two-component system CheB/CheR fusion protein
MANSTRVVGIGASAGGLEAIIEFFEQIPSDIGMAFIVIQHLSPDHKSLMDELLRKHTALPIEVITEARPLQPNCIYLISAQSNVLLKDGQLRPVSRSDRKRLNLPVDQFFHSLGQECGENAVGIILSGTGTDGSRGISAIKKSGGIVLVQDPTTAQFDGMPQSAIQTGLVDQVLPPAAMAKALDNIFSRKKDGLMLLDSQDKNLQKQLEIILNYVERYAEVDFREYRRTTLLRRIEKRMLVKKMETIDEYLAYLRDTPQEAHTLHQEFLIGVTRFFRDPEAFELLRSKVIPSLARNRNRQEPVRVWCAGCSTGEEAYTLALLLQEYRRQSEQPFSYKIFASDLDARAIELANRGVYSAGIENNLAPELLGRYFQKIPEGYKINKSIREKIVFTVHDALSDPPFINIDLVSCRNLLIYINPQSQQRLLGNFQFSLHKDGYIFLGPSESLGESAEYFQAVSEHWNIFRLIKKLRPTVNRQLRAPRNFVRQSTDNGGTAADRLPARETYNDSAFFQRLLLKQYAPIALFVNPELDILYTHGAVQELFSFPRSADDFNLRKVTKLENLAMFENGVQKALESGKTFVYEDIPYIFDERQLRLRATFSSLRDEYRSRQIVLIDIKILGARTDEERRSEAIDEASYRQEQVRTLERRLREAMDARQLLAEKLEATNEELQSSNEELLAANEELQSTNEELQSLNEELYTVNSELQNKVEELTVTNSDLDNLLKSTQVGTIFVDRDLRIRKFTPAIQQQFELLANDIGRPITNFVNALEDDRIYADIARVIQTGQSIEREVQDQHRTAYLMRILPYRLSEKDSTDGAVLTFTNVSPLRSAINEKEEQAERFTALFQHADASIIVLDPEDQVLEINRASFGWPTEALVDQRLPEVLGAKTPFASHYAKAKKEVLTSRQPVNFSALVSGPEVQNLWFVNTLIPIYTEETLKCLILISRDETEPRRLLGETRRKVAIFNGWYQFGNEHILTTDAAGKIIDINYVISEYTIEDILGRPLLEVLPESSREPYRIALEQLQAGENHVDFASTIHADDGSAPLHFENLGMRIEPTESEPLYLAWISQDVTEVHTLSAQVWELERQISANLEEQSAELLSKNRELRDINYYLDSFVQSAAHDLRAPVTQLDGLLDLTTNENAPELFPEIRENMLIAVRQLRQTIDGLVEMIDFEKQDSSKAREIDLNAMIEHMVQAARQNYRSVEIDLVQDLEPDLRLYYPEPYIRSLLHNLLDNAVKYRALDHSVRIEIKTRHTPEDEILISVTDNGIGIDMNRYGHLLFQPFKRLTAERPGTGIGLSIVNNAIRRNGGRIEVDSKMGQGSEFRAYLRSYPPPSVNTEEE